MRAPAPSATEITRKVHKMTRNIPTIEIAKAYLIAELSKIFSEDNMQNGLEDGIAKLPKSEIWRLLEALSFTYRLNAVFWIVSDDSFVWSKEEIDCNKLLLTGMGPKIDKAIHSDRINRNPLKFRDYLIEYFKKHPDDDPEGLEQFKPKGIKIKYPIILVTEREGKFPLLDGSNRLMAHLLAGNKTITAYVGRKVKAGKMKLGDSSFLLLRQVYEKGDDITKQAVITIVKELVKASSDGENAVETYWIAHSRDEKLKEVDKQILVEVSKTPNA